ncbi:4-(cytidine 5'-diphospho)-2-C-methyl-D-erythritol kinase [Candidatus Ruminimicrobiellum ovillum]|uniref:4-(cytidine 5'-diphospho)-2-C-methyl-D-erythritol kinase n=1 Tax=Candidatus Ruminimicrobiellum ovillum TaxID=1947927 RepID=UPI00355A2566
MIVKAPAKINLYLEIINKRPDGYHNIESVMHTVSLFDILEFTKIKDNKIELVCDNADLFDTKKNLVYKAAEKVKEKYNINSGVKIKLTKNIPMGAGLGGGSSDAAATILALNKIWDINDDIKNLEQSGAELGADVPFFMTGGTAKISGIGDIVEKINTKLSLDFVLVKPNFGVSTPHAYSKVKFPLTNPRKISKIIRSLEKGVFDFESAKDLFFNRFEDFIFEEYQEIKQIREVLEDLGCASLMSGSGATVFGLVHDKENLDFILNELKKCGWNVWVASSFEVSK